MQRKNPFFFLAIVHTLIFYHGFVFCVSAQTTSISKPYNLSGQIIPLGKVRPLYPGIVEISPDGKYLVFIADKDIEGIPEIYSVPVSGGTPVKLNTPLVGASGHELIHNFRFSSDSKYVVFLEITTVSDEVNNLNLSQQNLYSVPTQGGVPIKLNPTLAFGRNVTNKYAISSDSQTVVYASDPDFENRLELFAVSITGGNSIKLNKPLISPSDYIYGLSDNVVSVGFALSNNTNRLIYISNHNDSNHARYDIFSVPLTGGTPLRLNPLPVSDGRVLDFKLTPDGSRVVYRADHETDDVPDLYSVSVAGGVVKRLNPSLVTGREVSVYGISPDGSRVAYNADQNVDNRYELFSVPVVGGAFVRLNTNLASGNVNADFKFSHDGQYVVYSAQQDTVQVTELYSVPTIGGTPTKLHPSLLFEDIINFSTASGSNTVLYTQTNPFTTQGQNDLYAVDINGANRSKLNPVQAAGDFVQDYQVSPSGDLIFFSLSEKITTNVSKVDLFAINRDGSGLKPVNPPLPFGSKISGFMINPQGTRLIYRSDQQQYDKHELYGVNLFVDDEFCLPVKASNGKFAVICL